MEERVLETANALSRVVDQQLATMQASATALATSPFLVSGDFASFHQQAQMVLRDYPGGAIVLEDATGQQLVNSTVSFGIPLPKYSVSGMPGKIFETGKPVIANLFNGTRSGRPLAGVGVPVLHGGGIVYSLTLTVPAGYFNAVFSQQSIPPDWSAGVTDGNHVLVARNQLAEKYVGQPAMPAFAQRTAAIPEGVVEVVNRVGTPMITVFRRSTMSGWTVAIGIPKAVMLAEVRQWLWWIAGGAIVFSMLGIALALFLARRIAGSIQALIVPATALGTGEPVDIGKLDLAETSEVGQSLLKASQLLQQRTAERERAEQTIRQSEVRTRQRIQQLADEAQTSRQQLQDIIDGATEIVLFVKDIDGRFITVNSRFEKLLGITRDDVRGKTDYDILTKERADYYRAHDRLVLTTGQPMQVEEVAVLADGKEHIFLANKFPLVDARGKQYAVCAISADITERKRTEQALLRSEKLASVGRMAATIAHEINNPLDAVMNLLFIAKGIKELPESARECLEMADAELKRVAHITQQSLGFYRESNAPALTSVHALLESAVDLLNNKIKAKHAVIEKQWDGDVEVLAVAGELRQVFSNLLANSLDAIDEKGTIKLRVSAGAASSNGHRPVRVTVADNGKGVTAGSRQHIFEPFFTTKGTIGTGLGLWVSKQIIDKHGGTIRMRSNTGGAHRGTVFSVVLPVDPAAAARSQVAGA
jgi:PAS domain S-box-containing protein